MVNTSLTGVSIAYRREGRANLAFAREGRRATVWGDHKQMNKAQPSLAS
jgi:hypothetical protein